MDAENTLLNAFIGAVVTTVLSFTGVSPVLGGAVAGYLNEDDGLRVGALSGVIASIPIVGFLLLVLVLLPFLGVFGVPLEAGFVVGGIVVVTGIVVLAGVAYTVALSALGGVLGVYVKNEA